MNVAQIYLWTGKAALGLAFIIVLYIVLQELKNRWTRDEQTETLTKPHQHLKLFSVYYLIIMVLLSGVNILLAYPSFCNSNIMAIRGTLVLSQLILLTFFQLGRLQYCFSSDQQQSHGYPKCLFIILYIIGCTLFVIGVYACFGVEVTKGPYGCINKAYDNKVLATSFYLLYYVWNFTVLGLYWYKLKKITKFIKQNEDSKSKQMLEKIYLSLHKILLLTIINEIVLFFVSVITTMLGAYFTGALYPLVRAISNVIGSVIMYLMIEENNNDYIKIMSVCFKIFCCCKPLEFNSENKVKGNAQGNYVEACQDSSNGSKTIKGGLSVQKRMDEQKETIDVTIFSDSQNNQAGDVTESTGDGTKSTGDVKEGKESTDDINEIK